MVAPAPGDDQFDAVYIPFSTVHRLLNLSKLNDITITAASTGDVTRVMGDVTKLLRAAPQHRRRQAGRLHRHDAGAPGARRRAACVRTSPARSSATSPGLEKVTLEQLGEDARSRHADDDGAARQHRRRVAARRRHRDHEHHAAVGHRTDARDRHPPRRRRARPRRPLAVRGRSRRAEPRPAASSASSSGWSRPAACRAVPALVDDDLAGSRAAVGRRRRGRRRLLRLVSRANRRRGSIRSSRSGTSRSVRGRPVRS